MSVERRAAESMPGDHPVRANAGFASRRPVHTGKGVKSHVLTMREPPPGHKNPTHFHRRMVEFHAHAAAAHAAENKRLGGRTGHGALSQAHLSEAGHHSRQAERHAQRPAPPPAGHGVVGPPTHTILHPSGMVGE